MTEAASDSLDKDIVLDDIEEPSSEEKYIKIYRNAHPELEENEKKLEIEAKKKIFRFKPTKLIGFSAKRVEHTYFDDKGNRFAFIQERRQKPYTTEVRIIPKGKKNPDKIILGSIGDFPHKSQIWMYVNSDDNIYISNGTQYLKFETIDLFRLILQLLGSILINKDLLQKFRDASLALQILSKSKLPFLKIFRRDKINTLSMDELNKTFEDTLEQKANERKKLH